MAVTISVVIPVYNSARYLRTCLEYLKRSTFRDYECIVVNDHSTDASAEVAREFGVKVLDCDQQRGPAYARNLGAKSAQGEILFFIDADVCVSPNTLEQVWANFEGDPQSTAVIGSYDDEPESQDFLSLYKNLMHCFVHHNSRREACTFWSGCGAIRKTTFLEVSGFDESYGRPAIEDIELGYRLARENKKLVLDSDIQVKHLKRWSFISLVKTDILDRGVPWTELILRDRRLPNDLNLQLSQRVSVALVFLLIAMAAGAAWYAGRSFVLTLLSILFLVLAQFEVESKWKTHPKAIVGTLALVGLILVLAYKTSPWLIPPVLLAYMLLFVRHRYAFTTERRRRITGVFCGVYLLFVILFILIYLPRHPLVFCFYLVLSIVIVLNSQFYVFLAGRTGRLLALAAIPFHLLFHFYNGLSFLIGLGKFLFRRTFATESKSVAVSSNR